MDISGDEGHIKANFYHFGQKAVCRRGLLTGRFTGEKATA
jgi:hypothetical protein